MWEVVPHRWEVWSKTKTNATQTKIKETQINLERTWDWRELTLMSTFKYIYEAPLSRTPPSTNQQTEYIHIIMRALD